MGPLRIMDLAGLATFHAVASYLYGDLCAATGPNPTLAATVAAGETGARSGRGFCDYPHGAADAAIAARDAKLFELLKIFRFRERRAGGAPSS